MARKSVTPKDIEEMNEAYAICKSYTGVAQVTGWSASTVKKYIDPNYVPKPRVSNDPIIKEMDLESTIHYLLNHDNLLGVTPEEEEELAKVWKGMIV